MREELIIHSAAQPEETAREVLAYFQRNGTATEVSRFQNACRDISMGTHPRQVAVPAEDLEARVALMIKHTAEARLRMREQGHEV